MSTFLSSLMDHLESSAARDHARKPRPSRNAHGVTALEVCQLEAGDLVELVFDHVPNGATQCHLQGAKLLYVPHPLNDSYIIVRDHTGAPGCHLVSVAFIECGCGECEID